MFCWEENNPGVPGYAQNDIVCALLYSSTMRLLHVPTCTYLERYRITCAHAEHRVVRFVYTGRTPFVSRAGDTAVAGHTGSQELGDCFTASGLHGIPHIFSRLALIFNFLSFPSRLLPQITAPHTQRTPSSLVSAAHPDRSQKNDREASRRQSWHEPQTGASAFGSELEHCGICQTTDQRSE